MNKPKRFISAASIGQFREVVANVNRSANFVGLDVNGDAIYDPSLKKPVITFLGTVKCHGTFAAVCYNNVSGVWFQSKNEIITPVPSKLIEIEFEDGTKQVFDSNQLIDGKLIADYKNGDSIVL